MKTADDQQDTPIPSTIGDTITLQVGEHRFTTFASTLIDESSYFTPCSRLSSGAPKLTDHTLSMWMGLYFLSFSATFGPVAFQSSIVVSLDTITARIKGC